MSRFALVFDNVCLNVVEQETTPSIPGVWVDVTNLVVGPGHRLVNGVWTSPSAAVPSSVTMRQARLALYSVGKLDDVETAINGMTEPDKTQARIEWEYSGEVQRKNGLVSQLAPALGLTDPEIDALFVAAAAIP